MNYRFLTPFLAISLLLFSSCDKFSVRTFDKTVIFDFEVDLQPGDDASFALDQIIQAATGDLAEHKDKIKSYSLKSMRYKIWEYWTDEVGEDVLMNGTLSLGNTRATQPGVSFMLTDVSLLARSIDEDHVEIPFNSTEVKKIQQYLVDTNGLRFWLSGSTSSVPVHFKFQVVVDVEVKADVKD